MFIVLVAYAWAMMPLLFLLSFCFKEATSAYVWVTVVNLLSSMLNCGTEFNVICVKSEFNADGKESVVDSRK